MAASQPSPVRRLEPHNRVGGKYRLKRRLAVGGMGEVWIARNEATGADVALKVLRPDADKAMQAEERFRHEAQLSAILSHRNIIRIFDLLEENDGSLVLVMELLRGETLHAYLERKGPRSAKEAVAIMAPILAALQHAHDAGVIHRDVTPSNMFLDVDSDGHVTPKLVDFGIAKTSDSGILTVNDRVLGTPRYMSPEQIRGRSQIDGKSDLFSAGVVLYETLTGISPFAASAPAASLAAVLEAHIDPDPRIEPRLWVEIQRAISKRPYERHTNALELATALRAAVDETEGSLAASLKRTHPPPKWDEIEAPQVDAPQTKSIEGHSLALGGRARHARRGSWMQWIGGGVAVGAVLALTVAVLRGPGAGAATQAPAAGSTSTGASASASTSTSTGASTTAATTMPAVSAVTAAPPSTSAKSVAAPPPATTNRVPPRVAPSATVPRPVAKSPDF